MGVPSNETLDFKIASMEKQNAIEHKRLFNKIDWMEDKLDTFIEKLDNKFASKWVEWVVKGVVWFILIGVFWALLKMVLIQ